MSFEIINDATSETSQLSDTPLCNPPSSDNFVGLKQLRYENSFTIIIGHITINSVRDKFESLFDLANANLDALLISETKADETFLELQFIIEEFSEPYRLDRTVNGGGVLLYAEEDIPTKSIKWMRVSGSFDDLSLELNLRNKK